MWTGARSPLRLTRCLAAVLSVPLAAGCGVTEARPEQAAAERACPDGVSRGPKPILAIHHAPSLTPERYEAVVRDLTKGRRRLESLSDGGLEGLLVHVAGQGADGFWIVDVWESQEAIDRFSQRVRPIAQAAGIEEPMTTYAVHSFLSAGCGAQ